MKTSELGNAVTEDILSRVPKTLRDSIEVRASSINTKNGRCSFPFQPDASTKVLIGVVCRAGKPTGQYYVIPAKIMPKKLELKPADAASKWHVYLCPLDGIKDAAKRAAAWEQPREIAKLLD